MFVDIKPKLDLIDNIRLLELPMRSKTLQLAGTPDLIADYDGVFSVCDFKTSNGVKKKKWIVHYFLQCACYAVMYEEAFGVLPQQAVILMAVEKTSKAIVFKEPMKGCILALKQFVKNPSILQKNMAK